MKNREVVHLWAHQDPRELRTNNIFYKGNIIYSYGEHFPMARLLEKNRVLITDRNYSPTTSRHLSHVREATSHMQAIYVDFPQSNVHENFPGMIRDVRNLITKASTARGRKSEFINAARERLEDIKTYCEWMDCPIPEDLPTVDETTK